MARHTYAAQTLIAQVKERSEDAEILAGEPDGLNVRRDLTFDETTSEWLHPALELVNDPRIAELHHDGEKLTVTFVSTAKADTRDRFPLGEAEEVFLAEVKAEAEKPKKATKKAEPEKFLGTSTDVQ